MKTTHYIALFAWLALPTTGCDKWIDNALTPNNKLTTEQLNKRLMLGKVNDKTIVDGALINGIKTEAATTVINTYMAFGAMTDELTAPKSANALLYRDLSNDAVTSNRGQADGVWDRIHKLRGVANQLLDIEHQLSNEDKDAVHDPLYAYARIQGLLYKGMALDLLANGFSTDPTKAEQVFVEGKRLSNTEVSTQAETTLLKGMEEAEKSVAAYAALSGTFAELQRTIATVLLKHYMAAGAYQEAAALLPKAFTGKEVFQFIHNREGGTSPVYSLIGPQARDAQIDASLAALPSKAETTMLTVKTTKDGNRYWGNLTEYAPFVVADANEVHLIKAELILRGLMEGDARAEVNAVISSDDATGEMTQTPSMDEVAHLRHVFLFLRGTRLSDYRRGLVESESWSNRQNKWMPIPERELEQPID